MLYVLTTPRRSSRLILRFSCVLCTTLSLIGLASRLYRVPCWLRPATFTKLPSSTTASMVLIRAISFVSTTWFRPFIFIRYSLLCRYAPSLLCPYVAMPLCYALLFYVHFSYVLAYALSLRSTLFSSLSQRQSFLRFLATPLSA